MIYGDPFSFALQFDVVETWTIPENTWKNGLFFFYLDGKKLFDCLDVCELRTTFGFYSCMRIDELISNDIHIDAVSLYRSAESYFTGEGESLIDGLFDMTCTAMEDNGCYVYFMKSSQNDRFVWSIDNGETIHETLLQPGIVSSVVNKLSNAVL
ncbi:immunity 42 family protein [Xenorhabdus sp. DI]|uniref:immunity 42 family protein n=1 Tax=Xenorhabdus doucetiae TaxID=351671 RepID=UPI00198E2251|nr:MULTISPECIES: immunity 42 family protein [unclassified Xenorhabdus]MBD2784147.1 immunity 42 family protein [Xenorhabdus sp. 3]MBD2790212.1 immunity 42 family protein [Xenorhabdus sp. DI]